jgi:hypothetical protein
MTIGRRFYSVTSKTVYANGRQYSLTGGTASDISYPDSEAVENDQATALMISGATADRPVLGDGMFAGAQARGFYDTSLSKPVFVKPGTNPASWIDITGASA